MAGTLFKEVGYTLANLISYIEIGEIGLPDIQRPFVWGNTKVRDLFDSMLRGFPVGYLLFWENGSGDGHRQIGSDAKQKVPRLLIVDGQQRLTSLYAVLKGVPIVKQDFRQDRLRIAFRPRDSHFEVTDAAVLRDPEFIEDISDLWKAGTTRSRFVKGFLARLRNYRAVSDDDEEQLTESIDRLYDLQNYPFTALELSPLVTEEEVAEVFVRVNSKGTPLNQADFILTLMSVFWDEGRSALEEFCRRARTPSKHEPSPYNRFIEPAPDQLLRVSVAVGFRRARLQHVYSILRGKDLETGEFSVERRREQFSALAEAQKITLNLQDWHDYFKALEQAGYRSGQMVTSQTSLVYCYAMYLIGRRYFGADHYDLRNVLSRWFFMTSLTGRYTGASETAMEQDLARLRDVSDAPSFLGLLDRVVATS